MSKNNIRYSEYTHIWYYSGIQLFFSNWSILFLHGNNCVRMSETQKCVSEQLPYKLTENFFLHSILSKPLQHQGPGTNKNLVVLLVQFSTQYVGTYCAKTQKNNIFKKCLFRQTILHFFFVLSHGDTKFDYTTTNANDPCLETYWRKTINNICTALSFL